MFELWVSALLQAMLGALLHSRSGTLPPTTPPAAWAAPAGSWTFLVGTVKFAALLPPKINSKMYLRSGLSRKWFLMVFFCLCGAGFQKIWNFSHHILWSKQKSWSVSLIFQRGLSDLSFKFHLVDGKHIRMVLYVWQRGEKRKLLRRKILKDLTKLQRAQGEFCHTQDWRRSSKSDSVSELNVSDLAYGSIKVFYCMRLDMVTKQRLHFRPEGRYNNNKI